MSSHGNRSNSDLLANDVWTDGWVETVLLLKRRAAKYVRVLHVWKHRSMFAAFRSMANFLKETLALREKQRYCVFS